MKKLFGKKSNIVLLAAFVIIAALGIWCLTPGSPASAGENDAYAGIRNTETPLADDSMTGNSLPTKSADSPEDLYAQGTGGTAAANSATGTGATGSTATETNDYASNPYQAPNAAADTSNGNQTDSGTQIVPTATLSIDCLTILNNMGELPKGKEGLVGNGVIMSARSVMFAEGETVFDVLARETRVSKIHMESTFTPLYNNAYIKGINNLYELDGGPLSGWMYKVNGQYPNYGCSAYTLKDGDVIEWRYTCDLGADIGGSGVTQG